MRCHCGQGGTHLATFSSIIIIMAIIFCLQSKVFCYCIKSSSRNLKLINAVFLCGSGVEEAQSSLMKVIQL